MEAKEIRGWLLCQPRPVKLRIIADDAQPHEIVVTPGQSWAQVAQSIEALRPDLIEALDAEGKLLRAIRPDDEEAEGEEAQVQGIPVNPNDAESMRLITFAKLLAEAYKHSTEVAFQRLTDLFEAVTARSIALEKSTDSLQRMLLKQAMEQAEGAGASGNESFEQMMMSAFMQGKANAATSKTTANGKPEGEAS